MDKNDKFKQILNLNQYIKDFVAMVTKIIIDYIMLSALSNYHMLTQKRIHIYILLKWSYIHTRAYTINYLHCNIQYVTFILKIEL